MNRKKPNSETMQFNLILPNHPVFSIFYSKENTDFAHLYYATSVVKNVK